MINLLHLQWKLFFYSCNIWRCRVGYMCFFVRGGICTSQSIILIFTFIQSGLCCIQGLHLISLCTQHKHNLIVMLTWWPTCLMHILLLQQLKVNWQSEYMLTDVKVYIALFLWIISYKNKIHENVIMLVWLSYFSRTQNNSLRTIFAHNEDIPYMVERWDVFFTLNHILVGVFSKSLHAISLNFILDHDHESSFSAPSVSPELRSRRKSVNGNSRWRLAWRFPS